MYHEFNLFEDDGKLVSSTISRRKKLGGDWVAFYKGPLKSLAEADVPAATLRVYLWLASKQTFDKFVMTTPTAIANALGLTYESIRKSIRWLETNQYLQVHKIEGNNGYLLNPEKTTRGAKGNADKKLIWAAKQGGYFINLNDAKVTDLSTGEVKNYGQED